MLIRPAQSQHTISSQIIGSHKKNRRKGLTTAPKTAQLSLNPGNPHISAYLAHAATLIHAAGYIPCPYSYNATNIIPCKHNKLTHPPLSNKASNRLAALYTGLSALSIPSTGSVTMSFMPKNNMAKSGPASPRVCPSVMRFLEMKGNHQCTVSKYSAAQSWTVLPLLRMS